MKLVHLLNAILLAALVGLSVLVYPDLPDRIPLHFGADGTPDRWGDRTILSWLMLPLIGALTAVVMYATAHYIPRRPQSFNMPDKKKLLALPRPEQEWVMRGAADMLHVTALTMLVMFAGMQYGAWESAHTGVGSRSMVTSILVGLVTMPFNTVGFLVVIQRRLDEAWRRTRSGAPRRAD
jgi:uncharacterized membrane protein